VVLVSGDYYYTRIIIVNTPAQATS